MTFVAIPLAPTAGFFVFFSTLSSFGAGFPPGIQAVAIELYSKRGNTETGKLFGALSVLQALL
jgi:hypothetical protein